MCSIKFSINSLAESTFAFSLVSSSPGDITSWEINSEVEGAGGGGGGVYPGYRMPSARAAVASKKVRARVAQSSRKDFIVFSSENSWFSGDTHMLGEKAG